MSSYIETPIAASFQTPNRKVSQATTICSPTSLNKKSFSSTLSSSSRRSSSTPLADRFMSIHHSPNTIVTTTSDEESMAAREYNTPDCYSQNDQPLCAQPPLFLSYDPAEEIQRQQYYQRSSPPTRKKRHHTSSCCCCPYAHCNSKKRSCRRSHSYEKKRKEENTILNGRKHTISRSKKRAAIIKSHYDNEATTITNTIIKIDDEDGEKNQPIDDNDNKRKQKKRKSSNNRWIRCCCFIRKWKDDRDMSLPGASTHRRHGCFCYCGRREWVMFTFISLLVAFILAFVFWPRIPLIRIEGAMRTGPTKVTQTQQGSERMMSNVAFESIWLLNITMDNRRNYLPTRFNRIQIFAKDAMTGLLIGKGIQNEFGEEIDLPGHMISTIQLPISINYQARDRTDTTFSNLLRACTNMTSLQQQQQQQEQHHSLPIHFWFTLYIFGLDWLGYKPSLIATPATGGFVCPQ